MSYGGSTYVSLTASNHGNTPGVSPGSWAVLAAQGTTGATGADGAPGVAGLPGAIGPVGPQGAPGPPVTFLGEWLAGTSYNVGDAVAYAGGSFTALVANAGREPDISPTYWGVLAAAGVVGAAGPQGPMGLEGPTGYAGPPGAVGPAGPVGPTGPVGLVFRGGWSVNAAYAMGDAVSYGGASWISGTGGNLGNEPGPFSSQWSLLAAAGADGAVGPVGAQGPAGVTGATGAMGAMGPAGAVGVNFRGAWGSGASYAVGDAVTFGGSTYLATGASNAVEPDQNASLWAVAAAAGQMGPSGAAGTAATVQVGTVTTGAPGTNAVVVNSGTSGAAVLNFTIPRGATGAAGSSGGTGEPSMGGSSVEHVVSYLTQFYSVSNPNAEANETDDVLTWVPNGCTASGLMVRSDQGATLTVTLRVGTPGAMADSSLNCQVGTGGTCSLSGNVVVPAGSFVDYEIAHSDSVLKGVWTVLICE